MKKAIKNNLTEAIQLIKTAILKSRYRAATLANKEVLSLYYGIGKYVSENSRNRTWGTSAIETISKKLQQELPGLRGFSASNIKNMRMFFEEWSMLNPNRQLITGELTVSSQIIDILVFASNRQMASGDLTKEKFIQFLSIGFSHHCEIIVKTKSLEERIFYITHCATEFWSVETLRYHLISKLFSKQGKLSQNYKTTISNAVGI